LMHQVFVWTIVSGSLGHIRVGSSNGQLAQDVAAIDFEAVRVYVGEGARDPGVR
jgi:hypothetical protein